MMTARKEPERGHAIERHLGNRLKKLRSDRGLSEAKVDALIRQPVGTCKKLEQGSVFFGASLLYALARSFGVEPSYFFDGLPTGEVVLEADLSKESKDLIKAFHHIEDSGLRKKIIGLVKAAAD